MLSKESMDIDITTLHPSFVGKVLNVNLNTVQLDSELAMSLRQALWKHKVLVFPDQSLNPEQFETVGKIFGTVGFKTKLTSGNYFKGLESVSSTSNVHIMSRTTPTYTEYPLLFGGDWHSDGSYDSYFSKK